MATKAQIKQKIQDALSNTSGLSTWAKLESYLHTESESILENIYMTPINDTHSSNTITTDNANFNYDVIITKTGRNVNIVGTVTANNSLAAGATMFAISDAEYQTAYQAYGSAYSYNNPMGIQISSNNVNLLESIFALEVIFINITYQVTS